MIWPFKRARIASKSDRVQPFRDFRSIGETFTYLGRTCVVTDYCGVFGEPLLSADYADDRGIIHNVMFSIEELPALIAQNKQGGV